MPGGGRAAIVGGVATSNALIRTMRGAHLVMLDVAVALALTGATIGIALNPGSTARFDGPAWVIVVVAAIIGLPVAVRRRWPLTVLAVVTAPAAVSTVFGISPLAYVPVALALYLVGAATPGRRSVVAMAACMVAVGAGLVGEAVMDPPSDRANVVVVVALAWLIAGGMWALGRAVRVRRAYEAHIADQRSRQALTDERMRIAREVHDIVAHSMSLIAARAGIANHVAETRPEEARAALRLIESTSRDALHDMRRVLGVMRTGADTAELAPAAGLASLTDLADRARDAGVEVELAVSDEGGGASSEPPPGPALVAYRVVQESLTNAVKHAAPTRCRVAVVTDGTAIRVEVTDEGPPGHAPARRLMPAGGNGLVGMRERVEMYGGVFGAGPCAGGGFAVSARVPYERAGRGEGEGEP
jgi:signal transduction histidine kinase